MKVGIRDRIVSAVRNLPLPYAIKHLDGTYAITDRATRNEVGNINPNETTVAPVLLFEEDRVLEGYFADCGIGYDVLPKYLG